MAKENLQMEAGLCVTCKYLKLVENERGSKFVMCLLSKTNPSFRKYPSLPVFFCAGYLSATSEDPLGEEPE